MPTYQYECSQCQAPLEAVQSFSDDALTTCPVCNAEALRKVYGSVGVVFKGSGFYRNDSRGTSSSITSSTSDSSGVATSAAPSTKPESTPAAARLPATKSTTPAAKSPSAS